MLNNQQISAFQNASQSRVNKLNKIKGAWKYIIWKSRLCLKLVCFLYEYREKNNMVKIELIRLFVRFQPA